MVLVEFFLCSVLSWSDFTQTTIKNNLHGLVKTVITEDVDYRQEFGEWIEDKRVFRSKYEYDRDGFLMHLHSNGLSVNPDLDRFYSYENGLVKEATFYLNLIESNHYIYSYNLLNNTMTEDRFEQNVLFRKRVRNYTNDEKLLEETMYEETGGVLWKVKIKYDDNGNLIERQSYDSKGTLVEDRILNYKDGLLTGSLFYSNGVLASYTISSCSGDFIIGKGYNSSNKLMVETKKSIDGLYKEETYFKSDGSLDYTEKKYYDIEGKELTVITTFSPSINVIKQHETNYKYIYDDKGNWTEKTTEYLVNKFGETYYEPIASTIRTITYYTTSIDNFYLY